MAVSAFIIIIFLWKKVALFALLFYLLSLLQKRMDANYKFAYSYSYLSPNLKSNVWCKKNIYILCTFFLKTNEKAKWKNEKKKKIIYSECKESFS